MPDVTFLMKWDAAIGKNRIRADQQDRLESEKEAFHDEVYRGYLKLEEENPDRIFGIDASRSIDDIKNDIYSKLEEVLNCL